MRQGQEKERIRGHSISNRISIREVSAALDMASFTESSSPHSDNGVFAANASSIDDIFGPHMWPGVNSMGLNWHVKLQDSSMGRRENCHKICFRHGQVKGSYVLIVDGTAQITTGYHPVTSRQPVRVEFKMDGKSCCIIFDGMGSLVNYQHTLFIEGVRFPEARESVNIGMGERLPARIKGCGVKVVAGVAYYGFDVSFGEGETEKVSIYRRYSQFVMLDSVLRAQLDYHMVSSLPALPGKVYNPYFDQLGKAFLAQRHAAVGSYLEQLLGNSKACHYSDLFVFLGLDPLTGLPRRG